MIKGCIQAYAITFLIALAGCTSTGIEVVPAPGFQKPITSLALDGISLQSIHSYQGSREALEGLVIASAARKGIVLAPPGSHTEDSFTMRLFLRESGYVKGFRNFISLAILLDIRDGNGVAVLRASYLHDGEESFDSLGCLKESLDGLFGRLRPVLR